QPDPSAGHARRADVAAGSARATGADLLQPALREQSLIELRAHLPELGEEALVKRRLQVPDAGRAARARLVADLALDHLDVPQPPDAKPLIVVEQRFGEVKDIGVLGAIWIKLGDAEAAPPEQRGKGIGKRRLGKAPLEPHSRPRLIVERFQVAAVFQARQILDLAKLDRLKTAGGRQFRAKR